MADGMRIFKKLKWWILGAVVVLATAGLVIRKKSRRPLNTVEVSRGDIMEAAYAVGTVKAEKTYNLKTGVASRLVERFVRVGDRIKKGDKLLTLDAFPVYRAPFDGVVTAVNYDVGELVFAQSVVVQVVSRDLLYLELSMDERVVTSIRPGQEAKISFEGQRGDARSGKVRSVYASEGQFLAIVDFDSTGMSLLPGMTSDVAIQIGVLNDSLLVPLGAIDANGQVTVLRDKPTLEPVTVGPNDGALASVTGPGLKEGDKILVPNAAPARK